MNFSQQTDVLDLNHIPRFELYKTWLTGKRVLHIGCVDWPFNPEHNLHIELQKWCEVADGYDTQEVRYAMLEPYINTASELLVEFPRKSWGFSSKYDVVLVPEVIEHVADLHTFFRLLDDVDTKQYIITVPCAVQCFMGGHFGKDKNIIKEEVHPEHLCWYSPYTLVNTIKTHTDWDIQTVFWNNWMSVGVICNATKQSG